MGGLHSGRKREHTCIDDCLDIDTMLLNKQHLLQNDQPFTMTWRKWKVTKFRERAEQEYKAAVHLSSGEHPTLHLSYQVLSMADNRIIGSQIHTHDLNMVSTPCHYGGVRWWFLAPCCSRRVRVLYVNPHQHDLGKMTPVCRECQELHYASQNASYIERHISYEKHLLRNYGYFWASYEYDTLEEHHFEVTPEYALQARRSVLERELEITRLFISTQKLLVTMKLRQLKYALKTGEVSETDRAALLQYARDTELVSLLHTSVALERGITESTSIPDMPFGDDLATADHISDEELLAATEAGLASNIREMMTKRDTLQQELQQLSKAA